MDWLEVYNRQHGEAIRKYRESYERVMKRTKLPLDHTVALVRFVRHGERPNPPMDPPPGFASSSPKELVKVKPELEVRSSYVYNPLTDTYVTYLPGIPKPVVLSGDRHRCLIEAYSNFDGRPSSINELARSVELPRAWLVKYLKAHGVTHDSEPFSVEHVLSRDEDELVHDALQMRRASLWKKLESEKWKDIQNDALRWQRFETHTLTALINSIGELSKREIPKLKINLQNKGENKFCVVMSATDFHWGKYAWGAETGEPYNREIAKKLLIESTESLMKRISRFGCPEKIILGVGSDWFHVDNGMHTTTKGTPQDVDGTYNEILITGCELTVLHINLLRQLAPVEVVLMSGNHDKGSSLAGLLYLKAWFRNEPDVEVHLSPKSRQYVKYENTLLGFTHGDGGKLEDLESLMASEASGLWGETTNRAWFTGHRHHEMVKNMRGCTIYQLPSLSGSDRWSAHKGYVGRRGLAAHLVDANEGVICSLMAPVVSL